MYRQAAVVSDLFVVGGGERVFAGQRGRDTDADTVNPFHVIDDCCLAYRRMNINYDAAFLNAFVPLRNVECECDGGHGSIRERKHKAPSYSM